MVKKGYINRMLGEQENILLTTRQHWFVVFASIFFELVVIIVIIIASVLAALLLPAILGPIAGLVAAILPVFALLPIATGIYDIVTWWNRQYIVTSRRVIQISGIFNKNVIDSSLEKVNDVKLQQSVLGRLFDYGDVEILTASELGANLFRRIEDPIRFKTAMLNAKENLESGNDIGRKRGEDIPTLINQLDELRKKGILSEQEFLQKKAELLAKI